MPSNIKLYPEDFQFAVEQDDLTLEYAIARLKIIARDTALRTMYALRIAGQNESALQNQRFINLTFHGKRLINDNSYVPPPDPDPEPEPEPEVDWADIIDAAIPVGTVRELFRATLPSNRWVWMVGQTMNRTSISAEYVDELDALGAPYNGDGTTTIVIPDKRGRTGIGGKGVYSLGEIGGAATHALTSEENGEHFHDILNHTHTPDDPGHNHEAYVFRGTGDAGSAGNNDGFMRVTGAAADGGGVAIAGEDITPKGYMRKNAFQYEIIKTDYTGISINEAEVVCKKAGTGKPHNNMQPFLVSYYAIKIE